MTPSTQLILNSGVLPSSVLVELSRWRHNPPTVAVHVPLESLALLLERAFSEASAVEVRETDLDAAAAFKMNQVQGTLRIENLAGEHTSVDCFAAFTADRHVLIPWVDGAPIADVLHDCLVTFQPCDQRHPINLQCPRELYFGEKKIFSLWEQT